MAVESVEPVLRAKPHEPASVLHHAEDPGLRQAVFEREVLKTYIELSDGDRFGDFRVAELLRSDGRGK